MYGIILIGFSLYLLVTTVLLLKNNPKAKKLSEIALILFWVLVGWKIVFMFIYNNYMYYKGHEVFLDSPATIIVVYINTFFTLTPPFNINIHGASKTMAK